MKSPYLSVIIFLIIIHFATSCGLNVKRGNGNIESQVLELEDFDEINVGGNYDVVLIKSNETKVIIKTDENLLRYINTELHNQSLNINNVHNLKGSDGISIEIFYKDINKIYSSGASKIEHEGFLKSEELEINLTGAGAIELELEAAKIKINLSGAGVIKLLGQTDLQEVKISGAGGFMASELISKECDITLSGLGGAEINASEKLNATITGVGGIVYSGNPKIIEKQVSGFGKIEPSKE